LPFALRGAGQVWKAGQTAQRADAILRADFAPTSICAQEDRVEFEFRSWQGAYCARIARIESPLPQTQTLPQTPTPAPSIFASLKRVLKPHAPFSAMSDRDLDQIVRASRLKYFAPGETILVPAADRPVHCYVIRQGTVRGERPGDTGTTALWELSAGEMFPLSALLAHRGVTSIYRATEDTFCLAFPTAVFDALIEASAVFQDFCTRQLAHLLDLSRMRLQSEYVAAATGQRGLESSLESLLRQPPIASAPDSLLADVLTTMENRRIGSMPIVDPEAKPLGIFTRQDVIGRVVLPQRALTVAMREVMSVPAITLPVDATAGDAALLMAQRGIRHVVVVDGDGRVAGVVSERDLFSLQRLSIRELSSAVRRAADVPALIQCAADVRALSYSLVAQGVAAGQLTRMISSLNDQLTVRILDLTSPKHDLSGLALCWLGMGSEGRREQTIATDQDNGLIFVSNDESIAPDAVRERLLPFARAVNGALDRCGYPLCKGGVMAMNPRWCASLDEWKAAFANWIDRGDPDSLLAASVFFDFRVLWGEPRLADMLRADIAKRAQANSRFLKQMSDNALRNRPPLNWRGELQAAEGDSGVEGVDLKMSGSVPFVDAARIFALAAGITATNTVERLVQAAAKRGIPAPEVPVWCDAFEYVQLLRLREQHRRMAAEGRNGDADNANVVPLATLSDLDRRILKEAMRQIRKVQQRLELDYPG
jgi:CBS domain-containing protein